MACTLHNVAKIIQYSFNVYCNKICVMTIFLLCRMPCILLTCILFCYFYTWIVQWCNKRDMTLLLITSNTVHTLLTICSKMSIFIPPFLQKTVTWIYNWAFSLSWIEILYTNGGVTTHILLQIFNSVLKQTFFYHLLTIYCHKIFDMAFLLIKSNAAYKIFYYFYLLLRDYNIQSNMALLLIRLNTMYHSAKGILS